MHLFRKKRKPRGYPSESLSDARREYIQGKIEVFESGIASCTDCGYSLPLEGLETLKMVECPDCKTINFVPKKIGNFWLFEPAGGGGMGSVYKAFNKEEPDRLFAVKVLSRTEKSNPIQIRALLNEGRIGRIIGNHPCLVKCVASGYENDECYYAMELVEGDRLDELIELNGQMPESDVLQISIHLLMAEQHILNCGYLCRDLKPENVIVNREGYTVLYDYGLCMPLHDAMHPDDEYISGSPYYLPPERLQGTGEAPCSEIYSLGMVMYYALTGETFFDADQVESLARRHTSKFRASVSGKLRNFRSELVTVLSKMIKQDKEERYQSFKEVTKEIMAIMPE